MRLEVDIALFKREVFPAFQHVPYIGAAQGDNSNTGVQDIIPGPAYDGENEHQGYDLEYKASYADKSVVLPTLVVPVDRKNIEEEREPDDHEQDKIRMYFRDGGGEDYQ